MTTRLLELQLGEYLAYWDGRQWAVGRRRRNDRSRIDSPHYLTGGSYITATDRLRRWARGRALHDPDLKLPPYWREDEGIKVSEPDLFEEAEKEAALDNLAELRADYLERVRAEMRRWAEDGEPITPDDARAYFESLNPPPPEKLSRNFLACVFREPGWRVVGTYKSETPGSHANRLNVYKWNGE